MTLKVRPSMWGPQHPSFAVAEVRAMRGFLAMLGNTDRFQEDPQVPVSSGLWASSENPM